MVFDMASYFLVHLLVNRDVMMVHQLVNLDAHLVVGVLQNLDVLNLGAHQTLVDVHLGELVVVVVVVALVGEVSHHFLR